MTLIPLTQGQFAQVDDSDVALVNAYKWRLLGGKKRKQYAVTGQFRNGTFILMHELILGIRGIAGIRGVDHKNGDGLNNQRGNLRVATQSQNKANVGPPVTNTSGFKGLSFVRSINKWLSQIKVHQQTIYLGCFADKIQAALAYNEAAKRHFGEFAYLNNTEGQL